MIPPKDKYLLCQLILKFKDQTITPQELELMEKFLRQYPDSMELLTQIIEVHTQLNRSGGFESVKVDNEILNDKLWQVLADDEKDAPAIEIKTPEVSNILIHKVQYQDVVRKISKTSLFSLYAVAAAIILIFVFAYFTPPATGFKVAVLSDSVHAKWADMDSAMEQGAPIFTSREKLLLREGYAKLLFDNQTQVTIEGPAEFQVLAEDRIGLRYGKVYAIVPQAAIGFSVYTPNAGIIDLGTEFGIEADSRGNTCLHVMKGKTTLIGGQNSNKVSMEVGKGYAKKVSAETSVISDIPCNATFFVREINSQNDFVWKGQNTLNLADIVGGGNGLGTGKVDTGIDPISGKSAKDFRETRKSGNDYHPVPSNPYIDGVFIPDGRTQQIVSSQRHLFRQCPETSGSCSQNIISSAVRSLDSRIDQNIEVSDTLAHSLLLHSNIGITFDLQAIRKFLPGVNIVRFQSKFGIRKWAMRPKASNADFWVLVDGELRYEKKQVKTDELNSVDIELSEQDRFLTLIETDGGDPKGRIFDGLVLLPNDSDWGIFADPVLVLK